MSAVIIWRSASLLTAAQEYLGAALLGFKSDGLDTGDLVASITEWLGENKRKRTVVKT